VQCAAELTDRLVMRRPRRGAGTAAQLRRTPTRRHPMPILTPHERALRRTDAAQLTFGDRQAAAREHFTFDQAIAKDFVVVVAFFVPVIDAAHRCIAPVDDLDAGALVEVRGTTDQYLTLALTFEQHHAPEIRRGRV